MATARAVDPPILRYKSANSQLRHQLAFESGQLSPTALKRIPARIKALGGPILDDFSAVVRELDKYETQLAECNRKLEQERDAAKSLEQRLDEKRASFEMLLNRFTNAVEQSTQLTKQLDDERQNTDERRQQAIRAEKQLRDQLATVKRQLDVERVATASYKRENTFLKASIAEVEKELAAVRSANTLSSPEPKSRRDSLRKEEIKKLTDQLGAARDDLQRQLEIRRDLESRLEKAALDAEDKSKRNEELTEDLEITNRTLDVVQQHLTSAKEYLDLEDSLSPDDAVNRVLKVNEEISHLASLVSATTGFAAHKADWVLVEESDKDLLAHYLSLRFLPLMSQHDLEKRRFYVDLAIRASLSWFVTQIVNSSCFGIRDELDGFLSQVSTVVHADHLQPTAGRWRVITHRSIRASPQFPVEKSLIPEMIHSVATILALSGCPTPESSAEQWKDEIAAIHSSAQALEVDLKEKVITTSYALRTPMVDGVFLAVEMHDVALLLDFIRTESAFAGPSVKTILAVLSVGLSATSGQVKKKSSLGKTKTEVRLEPTVLLDDVLSAPREDDGPEAVVEV